MLAAFCGSHSTGKSTLLDFFRGKDGFVCVDSVTRSNTTKQERRIDGIEDLNSVQINMCDSIVQKNLELTQKYLNSDQIVLLDRCPIDFLAYTRCFMERGLVNDKVYVDIKEQMEHLIPNLDVIFYLSPEFKIVDDGIRSLDVDLQTAVDQRIEAYLLWYRVKAVKIWGPVEQRVDQVLNTLQYMKNRKCI